MTCGSKRSCASEIIAAPSKAIGAFMTAAGPSSMTWGGWDTHAQNFKSLRDQLPALDVGLSALISDLDERGMLDDVSIVMWGEFGRTPIINKDAGRDHWARVAAAFLAGGGIRAGQVVGSSDRKAGEAVNPVHLHQVHATLYRNLGIDLETTQFVDPAGRPQYLLDNREPVKELLEGHTISQLLHFAIEIICFSENVFATIGCDQD